MPEKKTTYWMRHADGTKALVTGADERDIWSTRGLVVVDVGPQPGEFVWLEHGEHGGRQRFPADVVAEFAAKGWHPSPPQEPVDFTKDPRLTDVPAGADKTKSAARRTDDKE